MALQHHGQWFSREVATAWQKARLYKLFYEVQFYQIAVQQIDITQ